MKHWAFALLGVAATQFVFANPSAYVCTVEKSAGLHYDAQTKEWTPRAFARGKRYVLRRLTEESAKDGKYGSLLKLDPNKPNWAFFDGQMPLSNCTEDTSIVQFSELVCRPIIATVNFDKVSRRFEVSHHGAYVAQGYWQQLRLEDPERYKQGLLDNRGGDADRPDDVFVEIGTCTPGR
ncbi:hypothetical protein PCA31118_05080 [Pandoraea captiosa]|uniref:Uncharacterized protein n=1 Tax=Pandoraea captiosa TaxID=2508302 RepID=A0A5E5ASA9_9BURK|nr:hypothetical protein [Pandoraea captiosa]VVE75866.1 hypothetical protein PCA31118_05080 [Pandoraea captiosa]